MKNITYTVLTRLIPMVEKDLSSTVSEVDENMDKVASHDAESEDKLDQELDRIRDRRENPGKSFLVNTVVLRHSMTILWSSAW